MQAFRPKVPKPKSMSTKPATVISDKNTLLGTDSDKSKLRVGTAESKQAAAKGEEKIFSVSFPEAKLGLKLQEREAGLLPDVTALPEGHPQIQVRCASTWLRTLLFLKPNSSILVYQI